MSAKDYGLTPVKINKFVHKVLLCQHDYLTEKQKIESSLVNELTALVLEYGNISPEIFRQLMVPRIHSWGGPWKWVYIREEAKPTFLTLTNNLNDSLPQRFLERLPQGVNASNVLSAMILAKAFNDKLVFKANHIESNFGYRMAVAKMPATVPKS